jgi:DNA-directed RNA polymerase specialized sigma24 family protein
VVASVRCRRAFHVAAWDDKPVGRRQRIYTDWAWAVGLGVDEYRKGKLMKVELQEVTPELIRELSDQNDEQRLYVLTIEETRALTNELNYAIMVASQLQARCQMRAKRLEHLGMSRTEIADMFDVPVRTVAKWLRSNIDIEVVKS